MLRRLICTLRGHRWHYQPEWLTGEPESIRDCQRCYLVEKRVRIYELDGSVRHERWEPIGRRPRIVRGHIRRER